MKINNFFDLKFLAKKMLYYKWLLHLNVGRNVSYGNEQATAILLSYKRMQNIEPIARSILKCDFIEKLIISNHNPEIKIEEWIKLKDERLVLMNQPVRRRCGYRWNLARAENARYFIAIDDDTFLYPKQIKKLFERLIQQPEIPHGFYGAMYEFIEDLKSEHFRINFVKEREMEVDVLYSGFFVTEAHVQTYFKQLNKMKMNGNTVSDYIDSIDDELVITVGDDIVISNTAANKAKIHNVGFVLTCPTAHSEGMAIHTGQAFTLKRRRIFNELKQLSSNE
ncbi:MAG: hypothetical protein SVR94_09125 [Pseudomonadota bacterium]|nr:hypothetical protein [Pseudomonadota bacterium]